VVRASRPHNSTAIDDVRPGSGFAFGYAVTGQAAPQYFSPRVGLLGDPGFDRGELVPQVVLEDGERLIGKESFGHEI